jgi:hypothetical protein
MFLLDGEGGVLERIEGVMNLGDIEDLLKKHQIL